MPTTNKMIEVKWEEVWEKIWKPCILTNGKPDLKKIENEMRDLVFIYEQIGAVYSELTGGELSKPMYYADVIISEHHRIVKNFCQNAVDDFKKEELPDLLSAKDAEWKEKVEEARREQIEKVQKCMEWWRSVTDVDQPSGIKAIEKDLLEQFNQK